MQQKHAVEDKNRDGDMALTPSGDPGKALTDILSWP
jgi:hypothetical protein